MEVKHVSVRGKTNLAGLSVDHPLRILDSTFEGEIDGSDSVFKGSVCLQGSNLDGPASFARSRIDGGLYLGDELDIYRCGAEPPGLPGPTKEPRRINKLALDSLTASGDVYIRNFTANSVIRAEQIKSDRNIFFWYCSAPGINLAGANVDQQINTVDCTINSWSENGQTLAIQLTFAQAKEGIFFTRSKLLGPVAMEYVNAPYVNFRGTHLQNIDLQDATVSAALDFGWVVDVNNKAPAITTWEPYQNSWMNLHDAKIGSIVLALPRGLADVKQVWPESIGSLGLAYERFYGVRVDLAETGRVPIPTAVTAETYIDFLERQQPSSETGYRFLGNLLLSSGEDSKGKDVLYAGRKATREEEFKRAGLFDLNAYADWFGSLLLALTIGYGYYMHRVLYWIVILVIVGAVVFRTSKEAHEHRMPFGIAYSFDMLLPVIKLRKLHSKIAMKGWRRYYFYFHKISGYILAAFVAAGLSGITK